MPPTPFIFVGFSEPLLISFLPPATPEIRKTGSTMRPRVPKRHRLAPGGPAHPGATSPRTHHGPIFDREALRAPPLATPYWTIHLSVSPAKSSRIHHRALSCSSTCATFCVAPNIPFECFLPHTPRTHSLTLLSIARGSLTGPLPAR